MDFWVYDVFQLDNPKVPFPNRLDTLDNIDTVGNDDIIICPTAIATSIEEVKDLEKQYMSDGYEGAIVREMEGTYEIGKRSNHLLKVKTFMDEEYKIIGHTEGIGGFEGCVIWICETEKGQKFKVVPKGTYEQRQSWFKTATYNYGAMLKVKFFELTDEGIPRFPVGIGIRLMEDM